MQKEYKCKKLGLPPIPICTSNFPNYSFHYNLRIFILYFELHFNSMLLFFSLALGIRGSFIGLMFSSVYPHHYVGFSSFLISNSVGCCPRPRTRHFFHKAPIHYLENDIGNPYWGTRRPSFFFPSETMPFMTKINIFNCKDKPCIFS